jgi:hypothetical protein
MKAFKIGAKVFVDDEKEFYKSPGIVVGIITPTRYSVRVLVKRPGAKTKSTVQMRFNIEQLDKRTNSTRV